MSEAQRQEHNLASAVVGAPDSVGIGRGTGCTFKAIREALRAVEAGGGGITGRPMPSRHWVRTRRRAANRLRGFEE